MKEPKVMTRAMMLILFISSVALGVGSAQSAASGTLPNSPNGAPVAPTTGFAVAPQNVNSAAPAVAAPAAPASTGPLVVSGPAEVMPVQNGFQDATNSNQAAAAAAKFNAPKPGATPFVPSVVESAEAPKKEHHVKAILHTTMGDITIRMYKNDAPHTVQNFLDLAKGDRDFLDPKTSKKVHRPFYTGLIFHRVIKDFVIQTGCPFGNGRGDPGYNIPDEISTNLKFDRPGIVAMALAQDKKAGYEKNSNGSQFFITLSPQPLFNGKFTIFGEVVGGMEVAQRIAHVRTGPTDRPIKKVYLLSIDVDEPGPALMQSSATPIGVNMALTIPPPTNEPPPVNQALVQPNAPQNAPANAQAYMPAKMPANVPTNIPQMPPVSMPMPASTGLHPGGAAPANPQMQMPPVIAPPAGTNPPQAPAAQAR